MKARIKYSLYIKGFIFYNRGREFNNFELFQISSFFSGERFSQIFSNFKNISIFVFSIGEEGKTFLLLIVFSKSSVGSIDMEQQRPFQPSGIFLFDSKNPSRDGNSTGLWIVASNDIISESRVYCAERRATYTYVPAWSGVFLLPLGYTLSFTCWSERETEVPAAGEDRVNGLPFCGLRPRCFSLRRSECKPRRAREYRAEEKRKSNNRREKWARFESGYETEHRRITVGEILSAVPLTRSAEKCARQRQIQFWITLPMGNPDALTDRVVRIRWWMKE